MDEGRGLLVVALGGNAIQRAGDDDSVESDFARTRQTATYLVELAAAGWRLVVTHGNGPQVGNHLLRSELGAEHGLPALPLEICVADTQGGMGYMIQQCLANALHEAGIPAVVAGVVTQVIVDANDPAFDHPSKPVGEAIPEHRVEEARAHGWHLARDGRGAWRRIVPSPDPTEIVEAEAIRRLVESGVLVVAAGGGGVPVTTADDGSLAGIAAVVDKDFASALLAADLHADGLLILTDVDRAYFDYGTPQARPIERMTVAEARRGLGDGHFGAGSMGPKVEALCRFAEATGKLATISAIELASEAAAGKAGTTIVR